MANYSNLLATIAANIYTNGNNEVTAAMVKTAVDSMVASLGAGYQFMGVAIPATTPGSPDSKQFYIASTPGTYTDFGGIVVGAEEVAILKGSGSSWTKEGTGIAPASVLSDVKILKRIEELRAAGTFGRELKGTALAVQTANAFMRTSGEVTSSVIWRYYTIPVTPGMTFDISAYAGLVCPLWIQMNGSSVVSYSTDTSAVSLKNEAVTIGAGVDTLVVNARQYSAAETDAIAIIQEVNGIDWKSIYNGSQFLDEYLVALEGDITSVQNEVDIISGEVFGTPLAITLGSYYGNSDGGINANANWGRSDKIALNSFDVIGFRPNALGYKIWTIYMFDGDDTYLGYVNVQVNRITSEAILAAYPTAVTVGLDFYVSTSTALDSSNTADWLLYVADGGLDERVSQLENRELNKPNILIIDFTPDALSSIRSRLNGTKDIVTEFYLSRSATLSNNPVFNFNRVCLAPTGSPTLTRVQSAGDDITPANYNNTYIGGNHGDSDARLITATSHGKTAADIGSIWTDGTHQCTLVGVPDEDSLVFMGENLEAYPLFRFETAMFAPSAVLTHVSGATNTSSITIESAVLAQWRSASKVASVKVFVDGDEITASGTYRFKHLDICEIYDVFNPASVLGEIQAAVGTFTETPNPNSFPTADKVARHSIVYGFDGAGAWTITTDFTAYQDINIGYFGFTQQAVLDGSNVKMYIPKSLPILAGGNTYDFREPTAFNSVPAAINITSEYWENPNLPPDRWLQISENIAIHSGFLPTYGVGGAARKDFINNAFYLYTSRKCYPHGIDSKISVSGGESFGAVVWRNYLDVAGVNNGGVISQTCVKYGGKCYLYADFNAAGTYELAVPGDFVGMKISVIEKSGNVALVSSLTNSAILAKATSATPMYGYLVLEIG